MAEPTPAEKLLELRRKRNEALAAEYAAKPSEPPPPAATQDFQSTASMPARMTKPGLADTTTKYRDALMNAAESQRGVGPEAVALANKADTLSPDVRSIPPTPGWSDQLARSFLPQLIEQDDRPASGWDRLRGAASLPLSLSEIPISPMVTLARQAQSLTNRLPEDSLIRRGVDAVVPNESIAQSLTGVSRESGFDTLAKMGAGIEAVGDSGVGLAGPADLVGLEGVGDLHRRGVSEALGSLGAVMQVPAKFQPASTVPNDLRGLPAENGIMYLLRVLGSTAEAGVIETAERAPVNVPQAMVGGAVQKALDATGIKPPTLFEKVVHELEPVTFGEIIGAPPGHNQKVDRESPAGDWFQGFLERVERGEGAEVDGATIATNLFGPEYANEGYIGGLLLSFLVDWEGAAGRLPKKMASIASTARAMGELNGASMIDNLAPALSSTVVDVAPTIGRQLAADVEAGRKTIDDPELAPLRPFLVDAAAAEGRTIEEVATEDGLRKLDLSDPEQLAREAAGATDGGTIDNMRIMTAEPLPDARLSQNTAPGNQYVVRNKRGDVVPGGVVKTVNEAVTVMRKRARSGDEIWRSGQHPIATWDPTRPNASVIRPTRGADVTGVDRNLLEQAAPATGQEPVKLTPFPNGGGDVAGKVLLEAGTGRKTPTTPPLTATGRMVEQAVALWARDKLGSDQLVFLPTGALVSHADRSRILGAVQRDLELVGLGARGDQDLAMLSGKAPMTPEQRGAVAGLARDYGLDPLADYSKPDAFLDLQKAATRHHGGLLADAKSRVRGVPAFAERLRTTLATLHTDRRAWSGFAKQVRQLPFVQAFTSKFFDDALAALPPEPRAALQEGRSQMERVGDDLVPAAKAALDAKRAERGLKPWEVMTDDDVAAGLASLFANARWALTQKQLDRVDAIEGALTDGSALQLAEDPSIRNLLPAYAQASDDPVLVAAGLQQYAAGIRAIQRDAGQDYLRMLLTTAGHSVKAEGDLAKNVTHLTDESLRQVYNEVVVEGDFMGPTTTRLMGELTTGKPKPDQAILAFMAQQRQKEIITQTFDRLVSTGAVLKLDERFVRSAQASTDTPHVLTRLLNGTAHRTLENGTRVYDTPPGATAWAERLLWSMGLEPGSGAKLNQVALSDTRRFLLPEQTQNAVIQALTGGRIRSVEDAVAEGLAKPDAVEEGVMEGYRLWKEFATTGVILPRPSYFLGQALGQLQTLGMNRSLGDLAKTAPHVLAQGIPMIKKPGMVGELITRLKDPDLHPRFAPFSPANAFLRSADGTLHSLDQLEDGLRGNGLADSIVSYETAPQMQRVIAENNTLLGRVLLPAREWQRHVRDFAGGFDQAARISIFLQEVERGIPYGEAARTARATALDFRALTPFEANVMRKTFTFYAYLRKSTDALVWALLNHPGRVTRQMRLAHWSFARDKTSEEIGAASNREPGRLRPGKLWNNVKDLFGGGAPGADTAWRGDFFDKSGRANPRYAWSMQTAPIGISDYILLQGMIDPIGALTDSLNPLLDMSAILLMRRKVGREYDTDRANVVPSWMVDAPDGNILAQYLGVGPVELDPERDDPAEMSVSATQANGGRRSRWAAGASVEAVASNDQGRYRDRWQQMSLLLGNGTRNVENWARVGVPRPGATSWEELAFLLGTPLGKELSRDEAVYQSTERLRRPMEEATRGLQGLATPPE